MSGDWDKACLLPMWYSPAYNLSSELLSLRWALCRLLQMHACKLFLRWLCEMGVISPEEEISSFWQCGLNGVNPVYGVLGRPCPGWGRQLAGFHAALTPTGGLWQCSELLGKAEWLVLKCENLICSHSLLDGMGKYGCPLLKSYLYMLYETTFVHGVLSWYFSVKPQLPCLVCQFSKGFFLFWENKIYGSKWKGCYPGLWYSLQLEGWVWEAWVVCIILAPVFRNCSELL